MRGALLVLLLTSCSFGLTSTPEPHRPCPTSKTAPIVDAAVAAGLAVMSIVIVVRSDSNYAETDAASYATVAGLGAGLFAIAATRGFSNVNSCRDHERDLVDERLAAQRRANPQAQTRTYAWELTRQAATAARTGDCATVRATGEVVHSTDADFYATVFMRDVAIALLFDERGSTGANGSRESRADSSNDHADHTGAAEQSARQHVAHDPQHAAHNPKPYELEPMIRIALVFLCGCSLAFTSRPEPDVPCNDSEASPIADAAIAIAFGVAMASFIADATGEFPDSDAQSGAIITGVFASAFGASSAVGFKRLGNCRRHNRELYEEAVANQSKPPVSRSRHDAWELTQQAKAAARAGDCDTVVVLDEVARATDREFHDTVFARDAAIIACMSSREIPVEPPSATPRASPSATPQAAPSAQTPATP